MLNGEGDVAAGWDSKPRDECAYRAGRRAGGDTSLHCGTEAAGCRVIPIS